MTNAKTSARDRWALFRRRSLSSPLAALRLLLAAALLPLAGFATPAGDLNGDGVLNVADLVRISEMLEGNIPADPAADLDGSGEVTDYDAFLLAAAIRGLPIPEPLAQATLGPAGGTLAGGGFAVVIPEGALAAETRITLAREDGTLAISKGIDPVGDVFVLSGLPPGTEGIQFRLDLPARRSAPEDWLMAVGEYTYARNAIGPDWQFRLVEDCTVSDGKLLWSPPPRPAERGFWQDVGSGLDVLRLSAAERAKFRIYATDHFRVFAPDSLDADDIIRIQSLGDYLEAGHALVMGQGFTAGANWYPIQVRVCTLVGANGQFVQHMLYGGIGHIQINRAKLADATIMKFASAHEFFHFVHEAYGSGNQTLWVDEASATWIEKRAVGAADYIPENYIGAYRSPFNGMHQAVSRELQWTLNPLNIYGNARSFDATMTHGYAMSVFFEYLSGRHDWDSGYWGRVYTRIRAGESAIDAVRGAYNGAQLFSFLFDDFMEKYLSGESPYAPSGKTASGPTPITLYNQDFTTAAGELFKKTGAIFPIHELKDLGKIYEKDFEVQELGAATARFDFKGAKGPPNLPPGTLMHIEANQNCTWLFAVVYRAGGPTLFHDIDYDGTTKTYSLDVPLAVPGEKRNFMVGVAAVNDRYDNPHTRKRPIGLKVSFVVPPYIEPGTATWTIEGKAFMQATASGMLEPEPGVVGLFSVGAPETWTSGDHRFTGERTAQAPLLKPLPQTMKLYADIATVDCGTITAWDLWQMHAVPNGMALVGAVADGVEVLSQRVSIDALRHPNQGGSGLQFTIPSGVGYYSLTVYSLATDAFLGGEWQLPLFSVIFLPPPPASP